ncbi:hypothetical protein C8R44DRAFT_974498 [Mycena epipterygia]|nr:hypothetical protein C8R44DRAFT_974498 [Mycena epipterygia]
MIGSWANSSLYIIELLQAYNYFAKFGGDHTYVKLTIALCLAVDTVSIAGNYGGVYLYTVTHWGDTAYIQNEYWPHYIYIATTGATAFIVQSYLTFRYFRATKFYLIVSLLLLTATVALVGCIVTLVLVIRYSTYAGRNQIVAPVTIWLVASAFADISLALTLVWQLRGMKSAFKDTQNVIKRLIRSSIQTGTITSIFAAIVLITYLTDKQSNVTVAIGFCLGRIYTLTLLHNLNNRSQIGGSTSDSSDGPPTVHISQERNNAGLESLRGIHVHRTAIVKIDDRPGQPYTAEGDSEHNKDVF